MYVRPDIIIEIRRWVEKAEHDLANAEYVEKETHEEKYFKNDE